MAVKLSPLLSFSYGKLYPTPPLYFQIVLLFHLIHSAMSTYTKAHSLLCCFCILFLFLRFLLGYTNSSSLCLFAYTVPLFGPFLTLMSQEDWVQLAHTGCIVFPYFHQGVIKEHWKAGREAWIPTKKNHKNIKLKFPYTLIVTHTKILGEI